MRLEEENRVGTWRSLAASGGRGDHGSDEGGPAAEGVTENLNSSVA